MSSKFKLCTRGNARISSIFGDNQIIYLKYVGKLDVPMPELTPEELAEEERKRRKRAWNRTYNRRKAEKERAEKEKAALEAATDTDKSKKGA